MASRSPAQIYTSSANTHGEESEFPFFALLPTELRLKIWRHALQRQRIVKIGLTPITTELANVVGTPAHGERYCAIIYGYHVLSKLLLVSSEARAEALRFYRVHFPCAFSAETRNWETQTEAMALALLHPGTFYFNPEHDILHLVPGGHLQETLVDFFHHLKATYDPRHVGALDLAIVVNGFYNFYRVR